MNTESDEYEDYDYGVFGAPSNPPPVMSEKDLDIQRKWRYKRDQEIKVSSDFNRAMIELTWRK